MIRLVGVLLLALLLYLVAWPVPISPVAWEAPRAADGRWRSRVLPMEGAGQLLENAGPGPEDVTLGPDGWIYAGTQDGRILRFRQGVPEVFADTGGRPLGMQFDHEGRLIVADAFRGLLAIAPGGDIEVLASEVDGKPMLFPDDLDIAADGTVWFTDASQRFDQHHWMLDVYEGRATGRLLSYDPGTGEIRVRLEGLRFANGVALGPDDAFVLVNETLAARITRLWLKGGRAGDTDLFAAALPGYPDNLSFDGRGRFWVALPSPRQPALEAMADRPFLRKVLMRLPPALRRVSMPPLGLVLALDVEGNPLVLLEDDTGTCFSVTSVNDLGGALYMGSIVASHVCRVPVPAVGR